MSRNIEDTLLELAEKNALKFRVSITSESGTISDEGYEETYSGYMEVLADLSYGGMEYGLMKIKDTFEKGISIREDLEFMVTQEINYVYGSQKSLSDIKGSKFRFEKSATMRGDIAHFFAEFDVEY